MNEVTIASPRPIGVENLSRTAGWSASRSSACATLPQLMKPEYDARKRTQAPRKIQWRRFRRLSGHIGYAPLGCCRSERQRLHSASRRPRSASSPRSVGR